VLSRRDEFLHGEKGCQTQKNALCFNGGMAAMKIGNLLDTKQFLLFSRDRHPPHFLFIF